MADNDCEALLSLNDAADIGFKIVEMADRVRIGHKVCPGAQAKWSFEMDGVSYHVTVGVESDG